MFFKVGFGALGPGTDCHRSVLPVVARWAGPEQMGASLLCRRVKPTQSIEPAEARTS